MQAREVMQDRLLQAHELGRWSSTP